MEQMRKHAGTRQLPLPPLYVLRERGPEQTWANAMFAAAAIFACCLFSASPALAQSNDGITVRGIGTASAKPTEVEFDAVVSGDRCV